MQIESTVFQAYVHVIIIRSLTTRCQDYLLFCFYLAKNGENHNVRVSSRSSIKTEKSILLLFGVCFFGGGRQVKRIGHFTKTEKEKRIKTDISVVGNTTSSFYPIPFTPHRKWKI